MASLARWCFRNRLKVLVFWIIALIGIFVGASAWGDAYSTTFNMPGTDSTTALNLLKTLDAKASGDTDQIVVHTLSNGAKVTDPSVQQKVTTMLDKVAKGHGVVSVSDPYQTAG